MRHKGTAHLIAADPILAEAIKKYKLKPLRPRKERFWALTNSILGQQISVKAAASIRAKFQALFPGKKYPAPEDILKTPMRKLRKAGLSRAKAIYVKDLAKRAARSEIDFARIHLKKDEEVIAELVKIKGVGRWTAEMFLMFTLARPNVFSAGDLGLQNAIKKLYKMKRHPAPRQLERLAAKWEPHRSLACFYLWATLDNEPK